MTVAAARANVHKCRVNNGRRCKIARIWRDETSSEPIDVAEWYQGSVGTTLVSSHILTYCALRLPMQQRYRRARPSAQLALSPCAPCIACARMLQVNPFHNIFGPVAPRVAVQMPAAAAAACRLALVLAQAAAHLFLLWGFRRELCRGGGGRLY